MSKRLPPELVDGIFHFLQRDRQALKVCSLVCKSWLYPAYRRLFYDAVFSWDQLRITFDPQSDLTPAPVIRRLHIKYGSSQHEWNEIFPSLDGFHSVTSLSVDALPWNEILPEIRLMVSNRFAAIVRLKLERVVTTSFSELAQIICSFRYLESLALRTTTWSISDKASSLLRLPHHLHTLELEYSDFSEVLGWFCSFEQDLTLRNVCLLHCWEHHYGLINTFLRVLGPSLESFRMGMRGTEHRIHLHHNTQLRSLHLQVTRRLGSKTAFVPLLSRITSVDIEGISLSIVDSPVFTHRRFFEGTDDHIYHHIHPIGWHAVDDILAREQFSNLKSVGVRDIRCDGQRVSTDRSLEDFSHLLPRCHKRGILRLCRTWI